MARLSIIICGLAFSFICNSNLYAGNADRDCAKGRSWCRENGKECRPDHQRRCGKPRGDWYGARRKVASPEEARSMFAAYFAGQNLTVSDITEKQWRFEADIKNQGGEIVDRVIIDRRSGRIRSIY